MSNKMKKIGLKKLISHFSVVSFTISHETGWMFLKISVLLKKYLNHYLYKKKKLELWPRPAILDVSVSPEILAVQR